MPGNGNGPSQGFMLPAALTRLMRKLRGLGLDTMILREGAPQRELVETAEDEDRTRPL